MINKLSKLALMLSLLTTTQAFAAQTIIVGNMLYNDEAVTAGVTQCASTVKFYTGSSVLCDTKTILFGTAVVVIPGITSGAGATTCTSAQTITSVTATPITANATIGAVYTVAAITYSVRSTDMITQLMFQQKPVNGSTHYAPIFDSTNGTVATAGTPVLLAQSHLNIQP